MSPAVEDCPEVRTRAAAYNHESSVELAGVVDWMMAWLLGVEWIGAMLVACFWTPFTWEGPVRHWNPHLIAAILSGPAFVVPCIAVALLYPGRQFTRHCVAAAQMLISVLLIDITGGRIETHFHVFGSLAFLAFYRDWRVLVTASAVTAIDHFVRGFWWPEMIYGITTVNPYRWLEHVWWVVFEDFFLFLAIHKSVLESREVARGKSLLYQGAYHDVLTGLANRRNLAEAFADLTQRQPSCCCAVLFVDLDRFKQVNDVHGHAVGDKLLKQVSVRLAACVKDDSTLARIGGDEFIIVLKGATREKATETGIAVLQALTSPFSVEQHSLMLSATVGISLYPEHGEDLSTLQERADQAMYSAKADGRNRVLIYSEEDARKKDQVKEIAQDLFEAQSKHQLHLNFQPLVGRNGDILRFETLLRWAHPKFGLIPPAHFIPIAERSGLIVPIGDWVLSESCKQCRFWQKEYPSPVGVAVNVSALQFEHPAFPERVETLLREAGLAPSLLTLELTESTLVDNLRQVHDHLCRLRAMGVNVSLVRFWAPAIHL